MKRTPFFSIHQRLGAKIVPFAGYEMPVQYSGIVEEHHTVRNTVGVFDVSHMGEFFVEGPQALSFLQQVTINDVSKLVPGKAQYSAMCYDNGGIVDDLLVYRLAEDSFMVVVNAANIDKDWEWMKSHCPSEVKFENKSDNIALLAIQGPKSQVTLQKLTQVNLSSIPYYHFVQGMLAGVDMIISRTGYTGELGFEIYFDGVHAENIWDAIFDAGKEFNIAPIGLGARDTLRLEMGYCLYGNDIDQTTHPLEAGLGWITKLDKGEFIGKAAIQQAKAEGLKRKLVGLMLNDKAIPRHGYSIILADGFAIGTVTSGTFSPSLGKGIAMGYVSLSHSTIGSPVYIEVRGKKVEARVVQTPFLKKD
ncbi:MAG: glycine cleavage system aminomethyltransferase GcvT [Bacteroidota bacterium]